MICAMFRVIFRSVRKILLINRGLGEEKGEKTEEKEKGKVK